MSNPMEDLWAGYENDVGLDDDDNKPSEAGLESTRDDKSPHWFWHKESQTRDTAEWRRIQAEQAPLHAKLLAAKPPKPGDSNKRYVSTKPLQADADHDGVLKEQLQRMEEMSESMRHLAANFTQQTRQNTPSGIGELLAQELVAGLAFQPDLVGQLKRLMTVPQPASGPTLMKKGDYAKRISVSVRKLDYLIKEGLPTTGKGRMVRVPVALADQWMEENFNDSDNEIERDARSRARQGAKGGR